MNCAGFRGHDRPRTSARTCRLPSLRCPEVGEPMEESRPLGPGDDMSDKDEARGSPPPDNMGVDRPAWPAKHCKRRHWVTCRAASAAAARRCGGDWALEDQRRWTGRQER
eukprot:6208997-Pyramimonas_sp.AAC.1